MDEDLTARWVAEVNKRARALDDYAEGTHPSALAGDRAYLKLRRAYIEAAQGGEAWLAALEAKAAKRKRKAKP